MKYLLTFPLLLLTIIAGAQSPNAKFRKVNGKVTDANNHPCVKCAVLIYGSGVSPTTDNAGKFSFNFPNNRTVVISVDNRKDPVYLIKVNPRDTFMNIKLNAKARAVSTKNLAEWKKNESHNSSQFEDIYRTEAYYSFTHQSDTYQNSIPIGEPVPNSQPVPTEEVDLNHIYTAVETAPSFKNGDKGLAEYLAANLKYPERDKANNVQGRVILMMVVERDGSLTDIKVVRGISTDCDNEAVRLLKNSPKWTPGMMNGRAVRSTYSIPIRFDLKE
ncbi:MAG: TonB family protein [Mucilaginibacter sp.]|nr:TonB family protein [Mucilaginibacter sp.]